MPDSNRLPNTVFFPRETTGLRFYAGCTCQIFAEIVLIKAEQRRSLKGAHRINETWGHSVSKMGFIDLILENDRVG